MLQKHHQSLFFSLRNAVESTHWWFAVSRDMQLATRHTYLRAASPYAVAVQYSAGSPQMQSRKIALSSAWPLLGVQFTERQLYVHLHSVILCGVINRKWVGLLRCCAYINRHALSIIHKLKCYFFFCDRLPSPAEINFCEVNKNITKCETCQTMKHKRAPIYLNFNPSDYGKY